jgi:uncharacterized membrane protein
MKPRLYISDLAMLVVIALPLVYLYVIYCSLPLQVATHFNFKGEPDKISSKSTLWTALGFTSGMSILVYLLLRFLPVIDPKKKARYSAVTFNKMAVAVVLLIVCINFLIIDAAQTGTFKFNKTMPVLLGAFFIFLGNILHSIKPNYFAGIRTPWTLESEETWRKTHQLGGKLWFAGGFLLIIAGLVLPVPYNDYAMPCIIFCMAIIPVVYSYVYYKSISHKQNQ